MLLTSKYDVLSFIFYHIYENPRERVDTAEKLILIDDTELRKFRDDELLFPKKVEYVYSPCDHYSFVEYTSLKNGIYVWEIRKVIELFKTNVEGIHYCFYDEETQEIPVSDSSVIEVDSVEEAAKLCQEKFDEDYDPYFFRIPYVCIFYVFKSKRRDEYVPARDPFLRITDFEESTFLCNFEDIVADKIAYQNLYESNEDFTIFKLREKRPIRELYLELKKVCERYDSENK